MLTDHRVIKLETSKNGNHTYTRGPVCLSKISTVRSAKVVLRGADQWCAQREAGAVAVRSEA